MASKKRPLSKEQQATPKRMGRLSMHGLNVKDALAAALKVKPPEATKRKGKKKTQ